MNENRKDLIQYRLERALDTFEDAQILSEKRKWNSTINRLYYSAFYAVTALLLTCELTPSTHSGVKSNFTEHFIKTGRIEKHYGKCILNYSHGDKKEIMEIYSILTNRW
jgi:uncharacterized protein (UPF0332 family)